jgi:hypothetical protein
MYYVLVAKILIKKIYKKLHLEEHWGRRGNLLDCYASSSYATHDIKLSYIV